MNKALNNDMACYNNKINEDQLLKENNKPNKNVQQLETQILPVKWQCFYGLVDFRFVWL